MKTYSPTTLKHLIEQQEENEQEWSPVTDSNRGPPPYHGGALPTELTGPGGGARIRT